MSLWLDEILIPYANEQRAKLNKPDQVLLLLLDAFKHHFADLLIEKAAKARIMFVPIEPRLTSVLQPADHQCGPNRIIKPLIYKMNDVHYLRRALATIPDVALSADQGAGALKALVDGLLPDQMAEGVGMRDMAD